MADAIVKFAGLEIGAYLQSDNTYALAVSGAGGAVAVDQAAVTSSTTFLPGVLTCGLTAALAVAARTTRHRITFQNNDATNNITIGPASSVTTANGFRLAPGARVTFESQSAFYAICGAGTPILNWAEEYDV